MRRLLVLITLLTTLGTLRATELTVFAAASLTNALNEIAPIYERAHGDTLRFNFGGSGTLARQITEGAPADLFLSADQLRADQLQQAGLLLPGTRRTLLANRLVLIVNRQAPAPITTTADLANDTVRRIAIGEPRTVPAGTYAKTWLGAHHLWEAVEPKTIPLPNVRAVLAAVASGNADAGIVYQTDAASSDKVTQWVTLPTNDLFQITYPAVILTSAKHPEAAKALLNFLAGPEAQAVFARHGFLSPE